VSAYIETQTLDEDGNVIDESRRFLRHEDEPFDAGDPLVLEVISDSDEQDQDGSWCRCQRLRMRTESAEELERAICAGMAAGGDELDCADLSLPTVGTPPNRKSGTLRVSLKYGGRAKPIAIEDAWD
jgi:hypothetical protein